MRSLLLPKEHREYRLAEKLRQLKSLRGSPKGSRTGDGHRRVRRTQLRPRKANAEAPIPLDATADHNELFLMTVEPG